MDELSGIDRKSITVQCKTTGHSVYSAHMRPMAINDQPHHGDSGYAWATFDSVDTFSCSSWLIVPNLVRYRFSVK